MLDFISLEFTRWWAKLSSSKKLQTFMLLVLIAFAAVIIVLYSNGEENNADVKQALKECKLDNKAKDDYIKTKDAYIIMLLQNSNAEKAKRLKTIDSLKAMKK